MYMANTDCSDNIIMITRMPILLLVVNRNSRSVTVKFTASYDH